MAKGDKSVLAMSVNDIKADENGNVALTAANVGADTAGAAQVVRGNLQEHIIDSVKHWTQAERDALAEELAGKTNAIRVVAPQTFDFNAPGPYGTYHVAASATNGPPGQTTAEGTMVYGYGSHGLFEQQLYLRQYGDIWTRHSADNNGTKVWSEWIEIATATDLANKAATKFLETGYDIKTLTEPGFYMVISPVNGPIINNGWFSVSVNCYGGNIVLHTYVFSIAQEYVCDKKYGSEWTNWRSLATATPPAVYDLPLAAGCSGQATSIYYKTQEGMVFVNGCIGITSYTLGKVVATLPIGYRPTYDTATSGHAVSVNGRASADIVIKATGSIEVWGENVPSYISFFAGFPAA